jgi:hypothetical protein
MEISPEVRKAVLLETAAAFGSEALGMQRSWGSNKSDLDKLEALNWAERWLLRRSAKLTETLPRLAKPSDWETLSDGAVLSVDGELYVFSRGHGSMRHKETGELLTHSGEWGGVGLARTLDAEVWIVDHNV